MPAGQHCSANNAFRRRLEELAAAVDGQVICPKESAASGTGQTGVILRCQSTKDVVAGARFARENGLPITASSGKENVAGTGVVVDLSRMRSVEVDARARRVRVAAGATVADVDRATQRHGLAAPTGLPSTANVASLALGGGVGWLRRKYGTARNNILAVERVTAGGGVEVVETAEDALLVGDGTGIVTAMSFRLHTVGPEVVLLTAIYALSLARPALYVWRDWTRAAPKEANTDFFFGNIPAISLFPPLLHNRPVVIVAGLFTGNAQDGLNAFRPLHDVGRRLIDLTGPAPYVAAQSTFDSFLPEGMHFKKQWRLPSALDDERLEEILAVAQRRSRQTLVNIHHVGEARDWPPKGYLLSVTPVADEDEKARRLWRQLASL